MDDSPYMDDLYRQAVRIRAGNKCEMTGSPDDLEVHHVRGKDTIALKYDPDNGVCLTRNMHVPFAHKYPLLFIAWLQKKRGQKFWDRTTEIKNTLRADVEVYKKRLKEIIKNEGNV